jgi:starvation-inducible DNA-binding protein
MYTKLHNYHWNVEGRGFFQLHAKLEELYDSVAGELDEVAERILQLGERPFATMKDYLANAKIKEVESKGISPDEVLSALQKDYEYVIESLKNGIDIAGEADDPVTEDMLTGMLAGYEKNLWMIKAYLA